MKMMMQMTVQQQRPLGSLALITLCALSLCAPARSAGLQDPPVVGDDGVSQSLDGEAWAVASSDGAVSIGGVVPGDLLTDLQRAGVIGDPLYENNFVAYDAQGVVQPPLWERTNFTYSTTFTLDARLRALAGSGGEILLQLDGIKMAAEVFLNGASLGVAANQFLRTTAPVAALLRDGAAANNLSVVFLPSRSDANNNARFMACSGGWDCACA
jgi:beta-galactosidase/beta-glucuronidase